MNHIKRITTKLRYRYLFRVRLRLRGDVPGEDAHGSAFWLYGIIAMRNERDVDDSR